MKYILYIPRFLGYTLLLSIYSLWGEEATPTPLETTQPYYDSIVNQEPRKNESPGTLTWDIIRENGTSAVEQTLTDQNGTVKTVLFDLRGLPLKGLVKNAWGTPLFKQQWDYDIHGNKIKEVTTIYSDNKAPRDYVQTWTYGEMNRIESLGESDGASIAKLTRYEYDASDKLIAVVKPDGVRIRYAYDSADRLTSMDSSDGTVSYVYHYDNQGVLIQTEDRVNNTKSLRVCNEMNQAVKETLANGLTLAYAYDDQGRKTKITLPDQSSIAYVYNGDHLKEVQRLSADNTLLYSHFYRQYNKYGNPTELGLIGEVGTVQYSYDEKRRLSKISSPFWSEEIPAEGYNHYGNICKLCITDFEESIPALFSYTDEQQLAEESSSQSQSYSYDSLYNRLSKNGRECRINGLNQMTQFGEIAFLYDHQGNRIEKKSNDGTTIYRYDALNRLTSVEQAGSFLVKYTYDAFNRRLTKTRDNWNREHATWQRDGSYRFLYEGDNEIGAVDEQGNILEMRVLGFGLGADIGASVAIERQGRVYAPIHDHRGSICCLIDIEDKKAVEYYRYTAFGEESIFDGQGKPLSSSAIKNPWRFSSKRVDRESGLSHFGNRLYDPVTGRWMTPDPIGSADQSNLYTYAHNNPLSLIDPQGLNSMEAFFIEAGGYGLGIIYKFANAASRLGVALTEELGLTLETQKMLDDYATSLFGEGMLNMFGYNLDQSSFDAVGEGEVSDKVRITLINGILTKQQGHLENANALSTLHGGVNIHYVFHATGGWTWDMFNCVAAKAGITTAYAECLAVKWKTLIEEMGGVEGGGRIIHYAHSLGAVNTANALGLMTPEEAQMIDVITLGSPKMIDDICCHSAQNYAAWRDGVCIFAIYGHLKSWVTGKGSYARVGSIFGLPFIDHGLLGYGYYPILQHWGTKFQQDYGKTKPAAT